MLGPSISRYLTELLLTTNKKKFDIMKRFVYFLGFLLIGLLANIQQVKADTIYYYLPFPYDGSHIKNLCVDTNNFPTFVIYKPNGYGSTIWNINDIYYGSGDSIVFTPTNTGEYWITSIWNSNPQSMVIKLFSETPPSPDFVVTNGGSINATGDTAWMCAPSITIAANNIFDSEATSMYWSGPNEFSYDESPVTISVPGTYSFTRPNPCGSTIDSIAVVQLPYELPVISNVLKCNEDFEPLDPGPGFNYHWSSLYGTIQDSTNQVLYLDSSMLSSSGWGLVYLNLENACISGQLQIEIERQIFPLPDLHLFSIGVGMELCQDETAILIPYQDAENMYSYCEWFKNNVSLGGGFSYTVDFEQGDDWYKVDVHKGSCMASDIAPVMFYPDPTRPRICVTTYDPQVGKNKIVFQNEEFMTPIADYLVAYKQGNSWITIDTVPFNPESVIYEVHDTVNNPNQQSRTYTVFARHQCGHTNQLTNWHKTILINITQNVQSGAYILQVSDRYETSDGYRPTSYTIWIDEYNNGDLVQIGMLEGNNTTFVIENPIETASYYASVDLPWNCVDSKNGKSTTIVYSNRSTCGNVGIREVSIPKLKAFPNPSTNGIVHIDGINYEENYSAVVSDFCGSILFKTTIQNNTIDLNQVNLSSGLYNITIMVASGPATVKVCVE